MIGQTTNLVRSPREPTSADLCPNGMQSGISLSTRARYAYLHAVKLPEKIPIGYRPAPNSPRSDFAPEVLEELAAAGFVRIDTNRSSTTFDRVFPANGIYDFAWRGRILRRMHLLDRHQQSEFSKYVEEVFYGVDLLQVVSRVLREAGFEGHYYRLDEIIKRYITGHRWHEWIARSIKNPLAQPILLLVKESGGAMPLFELTTAIKGSEPDEVRAAVDQLIVHLVLVEDFRPESCELMVGFLPSVFEKIILASQLRVRPPLLVCANPSEHAPHGSIIINDLRAVLLEIAHGPPRLRSDLSLYQTERKRFLPALEPLPAWLFDILGWTTESRLNQAVKWSRALHFVRPDTEGPNTRIQLSAEGHGWLACHLEEQYAQVFNFWTRDPPRAKTSELRPDFYDLAGELSRYPTAGNIRFFGEHFVVQKVEKRGATPRNWGIVSPAEVSLRPFFERAFSALKPGVFYRLDSVISHLAFGEHNPVNAGLPPDRTEFAWHHGRLPPFTEEREEAGKQLIKTFILRRLVPLGCVRAAIDDKGAIHIAREPSFELYFGHKIDPAALAGPADSAGKVVVQPDFSVIVIGPSAASLTALTLFCERTTKGGGQGATVLKITRESITKAVRLGLKPADIITRLTRLSSNALPANVLREVKEWSSWVRRITLSKVTVLRCRDPETADRVMAALRRQSERLSETIVAIDQAKLTAKDREKLMGQGIIVEAGSDVRDNDQEPLPEDEFPG